MNTDVASYDGYKTFSVVLEKEFRALGFVMRVYLDAYCEGICLKLLIPLRAQAKSKPILENA